jgi:ornithine cyclodeaminase/alanine dehydrogenase-like protein (mu-crystallin family)
VNAERQRLILYLKESDVEALLTMKDALLAVENSVRELGSGRAENKPRQIVYGASDARLSVLQAGIPALEVMGFKAYTVGANEALRFWVILFGRDGQMKCIMEAEYLSNVRTGAACGIATKYLARENSRTLAIIGTGYNAPAQIEAIMAVRPIKRVLAYSRNRKNLELFCQGVSNHLKIGVEPAQDVQSAVSAADVIVTITSSADPVLLGEWLPKGVHLNLAGAMKPDRREVDTAAVIAADIIVVDDAEQSRHESGELIRAEKDGAFDWTALQELGSLVASGRNVRQSNNQITVFKNHGTGLWDVAVAHQVYQLALEKGLGLELPVGQEPTALHKGISAHAIRWAD